MPDHFVRDLHLRLYGDIWTWAGMFRYRWQHTEDWTPRQLGIAVHAETVRIHPFTDGNGRTTRLLADLVVRILETSNANPRDRCGESASCVTFGV